VSRIAFPILPASTPNQGQIKARRAEQRSKAEEAYQGRNVVLAIKIEFMLKAVLNSIPGKILDTLRDHVHENKNRDNERKEYNNLLWREGHNKLCRSLITYRMNMPLWIWLRRAIPLSFPVCRSHDHLS
jgi:hypothetical protein